MTGVTLYNDNVSSERLVFRATKAALGIASARRSAPGILHGWAVLDVFAQTIQLEEAYAELQSIVDKITVTDRLADLRLHLKLYIIGWSTLSDVTAVLLNGAFGLGYADQDISFGAILRNRHIQRSSIPAIVGRHASSLQHARYSKLRNDLVHRGILGDTELNDVEARWFARFAENVRNSTAQSEADQDGPADVAVEAANADQNTIADLQAFTRSKATELRIHLAATEQFLGEIDAAVAAEINAE
jgi:hypothetical protein